MKPHRLRRRAGFTLVDVTITLLILGIIAAIAAPRFSRSLDAVRADCAARQIAADLNYARHRAMLSSALVPVEFTLSPPSYAMPTTPHLNRSKTSYAVNLAQLGLGVQLTVDLNGGRSVAYNAYGLPLAGSSQTPLSQGVITVRSGAATRTVLIHPQTGRASVQ